MSGCFIDILALLMVDRLVMVVGLTVVTLVNMLSVVAFVAMGIAMV